MTLSLRPMIVSALCFVATLAACGGGGEQKAVDALTVAPATQGCPDGYQHPKVCCTGSADSESRCIVNVVDPFADCEAGWTQYDDGSRCCSGDDLSQCLSCNDGKCGDLPEPPASDTCQDICPPGWYGKSYDSTTGCCQSAVPPDGDGLEEECIAYPEPGNVKFCVGACPDSMNHDPDHPCCGLTNKPGGQTGFPLDIKEDCSYPIH